MTAVPVTYLEVEMEHRRVTERLVPKAVVHRDGTPVMIAALDPLAFPHFAAATLALMDAEAVMLIVDAWHAEGPDGERSPKERFEQGDPTASEALIGQWVTPEGVSLFVARYRVCGARIDFDDIESYSGPDNSGRLLVDVEDVRALMVRARRLGLREAAADVSRDQADEVVADLIGRLVPGIHTMTLVSWDDE
ncbi:MAG TPA: hypothetical protein VHS03_12470 [Gaiellaceae bacterium]|jgi:hypothetical protein|nr:hypothetical protein [Gaiellaceae bacterium]